MVAYKLKEKTKHHAWQGGKLVRLNPGAILSPDQINSNFLDKFEMVDDVPEDRLVKLDKPVKAAIKKFVIQDAVGQKVLTDEDEKEDEPLVAVAELDESSEDQDDETDEDDEEDVSSTLKAVHKRGSKWIVVDEEGNKTHTGYMKREEAQRIAAEG